MRANQALAAGRIDEARSEFTALTGAAHASSVRGEAALGLGRIALRGGDAELAARHLDEARSLLRRDRLAATAELLFGDAHLRLGHYQTALDALGHVFAYLVDPSDRARAAYLIHHTRVGLGLEPIEPYQGLARGHHFPEYEPVFARFRVDPDTLPDEPRVVRREPKKPEAATPAAFSVIGRKSWKAAPTLRNVVKNNRLSRITIHHTADQGAMVELGTDDTAGYLRRLQNYFQKTKKWADLPYHFLIAKDGKVYEGRPLQYQGAHAGGRQNVENIGVALIGNFERHNPSPAQLASLRTLVDRLSTKHKIAKARIYPHCDLKETDCPGAALESTVRSLFGLADPDGTSAVCAHDHDHSGHAGHAPHAEGATESVETH